MSAARLARTLAHALGACLFLAPASALAFSDPTTFDKQPLAAGGGGRFFTGSPADGYTCKVCHTGGREPKLNITGLPLGGYRPGVRYEVVVSWPGYDKVSLALELTDDKGKRAGEVQLPPDDEVLGPEFCEPEADGVLATTLTDLDERQVINLPECGAKRVRFLWTAPSTNAGAVWFSGSAVYSDAQSDTAHDGVTDFGRVMGSPGGASSTSGQCSVDHVGVGTGHACMHALALVVVGAVIRRRQRRGAQGMSAKQ